MLGGVIFGHLSDRFGRIRVLTITILMFSLFTGLCAVAQGYWDLLAYRTTAGIGLGGEFGIGMALIAEAAGGEAQPRFGLRRHGLAIGRAGGRLPDAAAAGTHRLARHVFGWPAAGAGVIPDPPYRASRRRSCGRKRPGNRSPSCSVCACCLRIAPPAGPASASSFSVRCKTSVTTA